MGKIVAIGGGKLDEGATRAIDERIIALANRPRPKVLYVPTAGGDNPERCDSFKNVYGEIGDVEFMLLSRRPTREELWRQTSEADIIYVGGGNTLKMITQWRNLGVDQMMIEAYARGAVMCGVSAGAICWFMYGNSDSRKFAAKTEEFQLIRVTGLGLIRAFACPHWDSETMRQDSFREMLLRYGGVGIALEDCTALEVVDGHWQILKSKPTAHAYKMVKHDGQILTNELFETDTPAPIHTLLPYS